MRNLLCLVFSAPLAACGSAADKTPAIPTLDAQPITYIDIEAAKLTGPSCNYAAGKSMAAVVMAMGDSAVMKIGGRSSASRSIRSATSSNVAPARAMSRRAMCSTSR